MRSTGRTLARKQASSGVNRRVGALIGLHLLLLVYSLSGFFSKNAAAQPVMSFQFVLLYGGMLAILFGYAIGWQQVIKRLPLTLAFANKAVTVIWGMVWGVIFFGETITLPMVIGEALVMAGVVLFAVADGQDQAAQPAAAQGSEAGPDGDGAAGSAAERRASQAPEEGDRP